MRIVLIFFCFKPAYFSQFSDWGPSTAEPTLATPMPPTATQPGHPSVVGAIKCQRKLRGVNIDTLHARCCSHVAVAEMEMALNF